MINYLSGKIILNKDKFIIIINGGEIKIYFRFERMQ